MLEISAILENIGLTKSEIKVYLALIELGSSSTGPIVDKSGAASSKIYEVLEKLMQKGLVSFVIVGGVKHYEAASPKRLLDYLKEKQKTIEDQTQSVQALLPELEMKQTLSKHRSETLVFKGLKGAQTAFEDILNSCEGGNELLVLGFSEIDDTFQQFLIRFHKKRARKKISLRAVFGANMSKLVQEINQMPKSKAKMSLQKGNAVATLIYQDKVLFSLAKDRLWIQVKNKGLSDTMRERFEETWNQKVQVFEGVDAIRDLYWQTMDFGDYCGFGEGRKIFHVLGENFFIKWQNEKRKRKIVSKLIMGSKHKTLPSITKAYAQFKFIPGYESPGVTLIFKDKLIQVNFSEVPTAFLIEDKVAAETQQVYFDHLWNQDTFIVKGWDSLLSSMKSYVDDIDKGDSFDVIGAAFGVKEKNQEYAKVFEEFDKYRQKKGVHARWLFQQGTNELIEKNKLRFKDGEVKFLPYKNPSPVSFYPYKNKTLVMLQGKEPTVITINNTEITGAFHKQFEQYWNQNTTIVKGYDGMLEALNSFIDNIAVGDTFDVLGAAFGVKEKNEKYAKVFTEFHKRRQKKKVHARWLFQQGTQSLIDKNRPNYKLGQIKFLSYKNNSPVSFYPYKNKTLVMLQGEEPTVITINNKEITSAFKKQFELQWNQRTITLEGDAAAEYFLNDLLNHKEAWFIGGNDGLNKYHPKLWKRFNKERVKKKQFWHDLIDAKLLGYLFEGEDRSRVEHYKYKVLPKELSSPHVIALYGNKIANIIWGKNTIITITEDKGIFDGYMKYFKYLWKISKKR